MLKLRLGLTGKTVKAPSTILDWQVVHERMPWHVILLLGGGFALAAGSEVNPHLYFLLLKSLYPLYYAGRIC